MTVGNVAPRNKVQQQHSPRLMATIRLSLPAVLLGFWGLGRGHGEDCTGGQNITPPCKGQVELEGKVHSSMSAELPQRQVTALGK